MGTFQDFLFMFGEVLLREIDNRKTGGKVFNKIDKKMDQIREKNYRELQSIEKLKDSFKNYSNQELIKIFKESDSRERKMAAMEILKERKEAKK